MTNRIARRFAASVALAALGLATPALAQDKTGERNDRAALRDGCLHGKSSVGSPYFSASDVSLNFWMRFPVSTSAV